MKVDYRV